MTGFGQQHDRKDCLTCRHNGSCNQSGPLHRPERLFGTVVDRQPRSARKSSTFGMSSRTVADAKRDVRRAFRTLAVSTRHTNSSAQIELCGNCGQERWFCGCYPPEPWDGEA